MNRSEMKEKLITYLSVGYPGLYIQSGEEARVDALLQEVASELELHPKEWNLGYGWVDFYHKQPRDCQNENIELANGLMTLLDDDLTGKLFIIKDAKNALENHPLAVARLKQLLNRIQRHHRGHSAVILVSESLYIPAQIEAQITLLPLKLPHGEEISNLVDIVCQQVSLRTPEVLKPRLCAACSGLSQEEIRQALAMVRQKQEQLDEAGLALIQHEKEQIIAKSGVLEMIKVSENASDIGGLENLKSWLHRRSQIFCRLGEAVTAKIQTPKGVLIAGMPGCGKSLTAKAAASLFQLPLLRLDIGSLLGKYVGESENNMRRALTMAESVSPCILWIDELEKAFVGMNNGSGSEVSSRLFGYFLTWMQEKTGSVFVIATANNITVLPPELLRKGRFDEVFYVGFPNAAERGAILDIHLKGTGLMLKAGERSKLVTKCRDFAGADIQNAVNEAKESVFLDSRELNFKELEFAIEQTVPLRETLREQVAKYEELFEKLKLKPASTIEGLSVAQMLRLADDPNAIRRKSVATNEDCPDDLLEKLANDSEPEIRTAVYENPNCPERLLSMRINIGEGQADYDLDLLHLACIHPHAPHDLLASQYQRLKLTMEHKKLLASKSTHNLLLDCLLQDEDITIRQLVARNENLSSEQQLLLTKDIEIEVRTSLVHNNNLSLKAQLQLARDTCSDVREALAKFAELTDEVQLILARDESYDVRATLTEYYDDLTEEAQLILARDRDIDIRIKLASRDGGSKLSDKTKKILIKDQPKVLLALADNESISAETQLILAQHTDVKVRKKLANHNSLSHAAVQALLQDIEEVQIELAGNSHLDTLPDEFQSTLSQSQFEDVRRALARNRKINIEAQILLAQDPCEPVRNDLAMNNSISQEVAEILVKDESAEVRETLVKYGYRYREIPLVIQQHVADDAEPRVRKTLAGAINLQDEIQQILFEQDPEIYETLARNPCISLIIQQQLLEIDDPEVLLCLASNPSLDSTIQALLSENSNTEVRTRLADNFSLTPSVADKLIEDIEDVQKSLAHNLQLSESQYLRLFKKGSEDVREILASNPKIGESLMEQICDWRKDSDSSLMGRMNIFGLTSNTISKSKLALASNKQLPEALQLVLLKQGDELLELAKVLAKNTAISKIVQKELVNHKSASVREILAANNNICYDVKLKLMSDTVASVRAALTNNLWLESEIQRQLARDPSPIVRQALAGCDDLDKSSQIILAQSPEKDVRATLLKGKNNIMFYLKRTTQEMLARDKEPEIRELLAAYDQLDPAAQLILAKDDLLSVRVALAKRDESWMGTPLSEEVQQILAHDSHFDVRLALAGYTRLHSNIQAQLAAETNASIKIKLMEESNYVNQLSLEAQQVLVQDPDKEIRKKLISTLFGIFSITSSEDIYLTLAKDPDEEVRNWMISTLLMPYCRAKYSNAVRRALFDDASEEIKRKLEQVESCRKADS
ncbi:AAA family ATPase [Providencia sp. PROV149]|uniref:AAA family ATPase n=1 Tax=Providencia sp. PROV149 TaxID=2949859 RepID=UPI00234A0161|nr:AAA family ATPase [Providencia sp. PROV149]